MQNEKCKVQSAKCKVQNGNFKNNLNLKYANCQLQEASSQQHL
jgi:hypothetical protein